MPDAISRPGVRRPGVEGLVGSDRSLLAIAGGIGAIVIAAIVLVVVAGGRPAASFPPGSPQAAMQDYLAAWEAEDYPAAYAFFSAEVKAGVPLEQYRRVAEDQRQYGYPADASRSVFIDRVSEKGDRADVHLTVEEFSSGGGLGANVYRSTRVIRMVREDGSWNIDEPLIGLEPGYFEKEPKG